MWRRYSRGSKDIRRFSQNMGADEGGKGFDRDQFDAVPQECLEEIGKRHETIEALFSGGELNEEVHIAVRAGLVASHGAEKRKASDAELTDFRFGFKQALERLCPGRGEGAHPSTLSGSALWAKQVDDGWELSWARGGGGRRQRAAAVRRGSSSSPPRGRRL